MCTTMVISGHHILPLCFRLTYSVLNNTNAIASLSCIMQAQGAKHVKQGCVPKVKYVGWVGSWVYPREDFVGWVFG